MTEDIDGEFSPESSLKGSLKIGSYESLAVRFLPQLLNTFKAKFPRLKLDVLTSRSDHLVKQVKNGTLNMALVIDGEEDGKVLVEDLATDTLALFVCAERYCGLASEDDLKSIGLAVLSTSDDGLPFYYKKYIGNFPKDYTVSLNCDSFEVIRTVTLSGAVIGLLPRKIATRVPGQLKEVWPRDPELEYISEHRVSLIYRKNTDSRAVELVKRVITGDDDNLLT